MTAPDSYITQSPSRDLPGLTEARGVIADAAHHDDTTIARACEAVMGLSDDAGERARARDLLAIIEGERKSA